MGDVNNYMLGHLFSLGTRPSPQPIYFVNHRKKHLAKKQKNTKVFPSRKRSNPKHQSFDKTIQLSCNQSAVVQVKSFSNIQWHTSIFPGLDPSATKAP